MTNDASFSRRALLTHAVPMAGALALVASAASQAADPASKPAVTGPKGHLDDWKFLVGSWKVRHSRLRERLVGDTEWDEFDGTCINWPLLGGQGNVDDNVLELPAGTYRGVGVRAFDENTKLWSIWWIDSRVATIDPPVRGGFVDGVGTFIGADQHKGTPVLARFQWSKITPNTAHWEQAFSVDGGKTWEINWRMDFTRAAERASVS